MSKKYEPADSLAKVHVLDVWEPVPEGAIEIGTVQVYDKMTMHCDSVTVFNAAKNEARKAGGNVLKITKHSRPDFSSSCHQITALILKVPDFTEVDYAHPVRRDTVPKMPYKHDWRIALSYGYSWQTAKTANNLNSSQQSYEDKLRTGSVISGELSYFWKSTTGITFEVNNFHTSNSVYATGVNSSGQIMTGTVSDDINIIYAGPGITWRYLSANKQNAFIWNFSIGYMGFSDAGTVFTPFSLSGSTVGLSYDLSYDIGLSPSTSLGIAAGWKIGTLSSVDINDNGHISTRNLGNDERIGLGHIDVMIGLRFW